MNIARTILALLIAFSVAVLPAVGGVGAIAKSLDMAEISAMEDMDCCPRTNLCDKAMDDCSSMAACALKCFNFAGTLSSNVIFPLLLAGLKPSFGINPFNSQTGSLPFRPPRI